METLETLITLMQAADTRLADRHEAFGKLVKRFQDMTYGYAYAVLGDENLAQDAAQEAFISAYQNLGQLQEAKAFPGWLRRIVLTQCHRITRKKQISTQLDTIAEPTSTHPDPSSMVEKQELRHRIQKTIQQLPESQRTATVLYYINGYSQQEVAEFIEVSVDAVKKRLQRARHQLKERMIDMVEEELQANRPSKDEIFWQGVQLSTTLDSVAQASQLNTIEQLLVDGIDVNALSKDGQTLLHWAAQQGHVDATELLLKNNADPTIQDKFGKTPLDWAEERGCTDVALLLRRN